MDTNFINEYKTIKQNFTSSIKNIDERFANQSIDEATFNEEKNSVNNSLLNYCRTHLKNCIDYIKEKLNFEINIYIEINEFDISLREIKTVVVKNEMEFDENIKKFNYQLNNVFLTDQEKLNLQIAFEMIKYYHQDALKKAPKRQDYDKIKNEMEQASKKHQHVVDAKETKVNDVPIKSAPFLLKFLPLIIFIVALVILYFVLVF